MVSNKFTNRPYNVSDQYNENVDILSVNKNCSPGKHTKLNVYKKEFVAPDHFGGV